MFSGRNTRYATGNRAARRSSELRCKDGKEPRAPAWEERPGRGHECKDHVWPPRGRCVRRGHALGVRADVPQAAGRGHGEPGSAAPAPLWGARPPAPAAFSDQSEVANPGAGKRGAPLAHDVSLLRPAAGSAPARRWLCPCNPLTALRTLGVARCHPSHLRLPCPGYRNPGRTVHT